MTNTQVWRRAVRRGNRRRIGACCALVLAAAVAVAGCSASGGDASSAQRDDAAGAKQADSAPYDAATPTPSGATGSGTTRSGTAPAATPATYVVRTATLSVRTPHVQDQLARARQDADRAGGYAGDETTTVDAHGRAASTIQLRVPPSRYDAVLAELGSLGKLLERKVNVQDVTGQVVDVKSRITSQQASVARVRALMDKATDLTDVVSLEGELSTRESALESLEAQQKSLTSRTDLATITLKLSEPPVKAAVARPAGHRGFWSTVGHAFAVGWHGFTVAVRGLLVALAVALPFLAVVALVGYLAYRLRRRVP
ncbi:protein of unknown function [Actinacidiphila yanglinensis]|uniref:DUF4349 domain-containing protein n=1 Tax=Actinacidiphila yanglinensis TaxID=310779 RepID=A0A1H5XAW3_9ACTN|nr:DUF4349 domain-containing protein [Actinacidiphila yanglinensis]SEG08879.1 protein of unknown function [Actinacidiphila yanglinensis]